MMLEAVNVTKFYGARQALAGVSFSVGEGEAVGLLGVDGSGKSTIMRILSGFLAPTNGTVRVGVEDPRRAATRRIIGYLPGGNPLPLQSRVRKYLRYRAGLKGLTGRAGAEAVEETAGTCGIDDVLNNVIGHIPEETRRRVGLAESVIAKPHLLLFDDPAAGLDPGGARRVRELIGQLGQDHAVLLAGRSLEDVEQLCGRAIILDKGRIAADGDLADIRDRNIEERVVNLEMICSEPVRETLRAVPGVQTVSVAPHGDAPGALAIRVTTQAGIDLRQKLSQECARRGWLITAMRLEPIRLEDMLPKLAARTSHTRRIP